MVGSCNKTIPALKNEDFIFLRNVGNPAATMQEALLKIVPYLKTNMTPDELNLLRKTITTLRGRMCRNWASSQRTPDIFLQKFGNWLASSIAVPERLVASASLAALPPASPARSSTSSTNQVPVSVAVPVRKTQVFIYDSDTKTHTKMTAEVVEMEMEVEQEQTEVVSDKTEDPLVIKPSDVKRGLPSPAPLYGEIKLNRKNRRGYHEIGPRMQQKIVTRIYNSQSDETVPLLKATIRTLRHRGNTDTAALIAETLESPDRATKMVKRLKIGAAAEGQTPFTPEEALTLQQKLGLTKEKYNLLRSACVKKGYKDLFPAYGQVYEAKKVPDEDDEGNVTEFQIVKS